MKIRTLTLITVAIMLVSLFTVTAMAGTQDRDRDQDCTNVPTEAPRTQIRAGINTGDNVAEITSYSVGDNFVDEDGDGICDNCQGDGVCDGETDRLYQKLRNGSCQE